MKLPFLIMKLDVFGALPVLCSISFHLKCESFEPECNLLQLVVTVYAYSVIYINLCWHPSNLSNIKLTFSYNYVLN